MGFMNKIFNNVFHEQATVESTSSFESLSEEELEAHLQVNHYGQFQLSEAVRPSFDLKVVPSAGYRHDVYHDDENRTRIPVLMASASRSGLFELFMELLDALGSIVDVVLETSHAHQQQGHVDLYREHIDMPILQSVLWDFEDLLVDDGCTGIAVLNPACQQEVQFDEHKLLIVYGQELSEYAAILDAAEVPCRDDMQFITEAEHVHSTSEQFIERFAELKSRLGIDGYAY